MLRTDDAITPGSSDHVSFAAAGVPVLSFSTGLTDDYHRPSDDPERLDYVGMQAIATYAFEVVQQAAHHPENFVSPAKGDAGAGRLPGADGL